MSDLTRRGLLRGAVLGAVGTAIVRPAVAEGAPPVPTVAPAPPPGGAAGVETVSVTAEVNGTSRTFMVDGDERALDFLRARCGLKGTKESCGTGSCGACTALVDGVPHVTCLLPAVALEGHHVTTVEGLSGGVAAVGALHPVQRAFLAKDALQCGYCTPGFVVTASVFVDAWRAAHGTEAPDADTIAAALAGHVCRCGAYPAIREAVAAACRGEHDGPTVEFARPDAPEKVSGLAVYTVDVAVEGLLEGRILRSPHAHATLRSLDESGARGLSGVKAVVRFVEDGGLVRYAGQEIAAVAAVDRKTADKAVALLVADYDIMPAVTSMAAARAQGAPVVYAEGDDREAPSAGDGPPQSAPLEGNVRGPMSSTLFGEPKQGRDGVDIAKRSGDEAHGTWSTGVQVHAALEPHAVIVRWKAKHEAEVWASTQGAQSLSDAMAEFYDTNARKIVVHTQHVGGAFGGKVGMQMETRAAADLAKAAAAPVRVVLDPVEELTVGGHRPAQEVSVAVGLSSRGELLGIVYEAYADSGVAVSHNSGAGPRQLYEAPKDLDDWDVTTHTPPAMPMRGPGAPAAFFALEGAIDMIGTKRDSSPVGLRKQFDRDIARNDLYRWAEALPALRDRGPPGKDTGRIRRGVGFAAGAWYDEWDPHCQVELEFGSDHVLVRCGTQDVGTGTRGLLAAVVGDALGLPAREITVEIGESSFAHGPVSAASRSAASLTPAAEHAVELVAEALTERALRRKWEGAAAKGGFQKTDGTLVTWRELAEGAPPLKVVGRRKEDDKAATLPFAVDELKIGKISAAVVNITAVEVDTRLARVRVREAWVGIGAGRILSETLARSQVQGAFAQNVGLALFEDRVLDPATGRLLSHSLDDYHLPGLGDVPEVHVHFEPRGFEHVRGGAVGLSELGGVAVAASIANAVHHALGKRPFRLPLDPRAVRELLT